MTTSRTKFYSLWVYSGHQGFNRLWFHAGMGEMPAVGAWITIGIENFRVHSVSQVTRWAVR